MLDAASSQDEITAILFEQADRLLAEHLTPDCLNAADKGEFPAKAWGAIVDAGLMLTLVAEEKGGAGLGATAGARLIRSSAYHALPAPFAETLIAQVLWTEAGGAVVEGSITIAHTDGARLAGPANGRVLSARIERAPWAESADHVLLLAADDRGESHLVLLPSGNHAAVSRRNLANEPRASFVVNAAPIGNDTVLPAPAMLRDADGLLAFGAFARAHQMVGAMERCLTLALDFANERKQFGKPIGRFQAVQHMLAEAAGEQAVALAAAELATRAWNSKAFPSAVAIAKSRAGEAAGKVAEVCHQVHGAMGFTHEHSLHFFTRRLWSWRDEFGHEGFWQERLGRDICKRGGEALWPYLAALRGGSR